MSRILARWFYNIAGLIILGGVLVLISMWTVLLNDALYPDEHVHECVCVEVASLPGEAP